MAAWRRRAFACVLAGLALTTLLLFGIASVHFADDGGAAVAEAGRLSLRRCRLARLRVEAVRPGALSAPLRRGGGLVLLGYDGGDRPLAERRAGTGRRDASEMRIFLCAACLGPCS